MKLTNVLAQNMDMYYVLLLYDKCVCKLCKRRGSVRPSLLKVDYNC